MTSDKPPAVGSKIEFWPDYGGALLWVAGERIDLRELPLSPDLVGTASVWLADYDDVKLPWESTRDDAWLAQGRHLFGELRDALWEHGIELVAGEEHWRP